MTNRESIFGVSGGAVPLLLLLLPALLADLSNAHGAVSKPMGRNYCWQHPDPAVSAACKERYGGSGNVS